MLKELREFDIDIAKLSNKAHEYDFKVEEPFFECFEGSLFSKGKCDVKVKLNKSETMIIAEFIVNGYIELICDRSLEPFDSVVNLHEQIIFKYGDEEKEISDEIVIIPHGTQKLNLAQYIYEFISLTVPMKKVHPRFLQEENPDDESDILIYTSATSEDTPKAEQNGKHDDEDDIDPRWKDLKKLL